MKNSFAQGLDALVQMQKRFGRPPKDFAVIRRSVKELVHRNGLRGHPTERYFRLLATCALLGLEPLHNSYKPRKKVKK